MAKNELHLVLASLHSASEFYDKLVTAIDNLLRNMNLHEVCINVLAREYSMALHEWLESEYTDVLLFLDAIPQEQQRQFLSKV